MTLHTDAIFEGGVLRPLEPLALPEHQVVSLAISTPPVEESEEEEAARQRAAVMAFIASVEAEPGPPPPNDGLSNRDHDKIIYGDIR